MATFIFRRLLQSVFILLIVTFISFVMMTMAPGNAMSTFIDPRIPPSELAKAEASLGLDQPAYVQYVRWLGAVVNGNLGYSIKTGEGVLELIANRLIPTVSLMAVAFTLMLVLALLIGIVSAARPYSPVDYLATFLAFAGISIPSFFFALTLIYVFAVQLGWLPTSGLESYQQDFEGWALVANRMRHLVLPVTVLTFTGVAELVRHVRSAVSESLQQDYIRTAKSKGLKDIHVLTLHALRNSWLPIITLLGVALPRFFSGSVIVEVIFAWPGMGRLLVESVFARDYPVAMGINLFAAILVLLGSLLADSLYALADPRIRYL
ncbi:MAG: ABC transporter permease [Deinococcota bacterium]